jgi:hypothetical protein
MTKSTQEVNEGLVMEIQGITLKEGIESKYEFQLIKCNKGGYIAIRGNDVGAHLNIDDALEFLRRDIKMFMNEPLTPPDLPRVPSSSSGGHKSDMRYSDTLQRVRPAMAIAHTGGRRWTNGDIVGLTMLFILLAILAFQGVYKWWPDLL